MSNIYYHGSDKKIEIFNPYAFDLGNSFQKFGWSTFCFKNYNYTKGFTIMRCIQRYYDKVKTNENRMYLHSNRCTWDFVNEKPIITKEGLNYVLKNMIGTEIYIHYIDSSKLKNKGIGNDITHKEVTFRDKNVLPMKIEKITFTKELLENYLIVVEDVNKYRNYLVAISNNYNRGFLSLFITYDYTLNRDEIEKIITAVNNGVIKKGEDLYKFIKNNNVNIKKIPILKRIKKAFLGTINRNIFRYKYINKLKKYNEKLKQK